MMSKRRRKKKQQQRVKQPRWNGTQIVMLTTMLSRKTKPARNRNSNNNKKCRWFNQQILNTANDHQQQQRQQHFPASLPSPPSMPAILLCSSMSSSQSGHFQQHWFTASQLQPWSSPSASATVPPPPPSATTNHCCASLLASNVVSTSTTCFTMQTPRRRTSRIPVLLKSKMSWSCYEQPKKNMVQSATITTTFANRMHSSAIEEMATPNGTQGNQHLKERSTSNNQFVPILDWTLASNTSSREQLAYVPTTYDDIEMPTTAKAIGGFGGCPCLHSTATSCKSMENIFASPDYIATFSAQNRIEEAKKNAIFHRLRPHPIVKMKKRRKCFWKRQIQLFISEFIAETTVLSYVVGGTMPMTEKLTQKEKMAHQNDEKAANNVLASERTAALAISRWFQQVRNDPLEAAIACAGAALFFRVLGVLVNILLLLCQGEI